MDRRTREADAARKRLNAGGAVHLMGIGGVGVAAVAHLLADRGFEVSGCDAVPNRCTERLAARGVRIFDGHDPAHLTPAPDWLIRSAAVPEDHPEVRAALRAGIPVSRRGEALAALVGLGPSVAVCGTHGKTTTTAMLIHIFRAAGLPPSFAIGAELETPGLVAGTGASPWLVVEADESDGTLALYHPRSTVVTNVDLDHLEHFRDLDEFHGVFAAVIRQTAGAVCWCRDDAAAARLAAGRANTIAFGFDSAAEVRAERRRTRGMAQEFDAFAFGRALGTVRLPIPGEHNVRNALGAVAAAAAAGIEPAAAAAALASFRLPRRRLDIRLRRPDLCILTDYAHHPAEIRALLAAIRDAFDCRRLIAVFQPHRYTRTRAMLAEFPPAFRGVDQVILTPVYAASEAPLPGGAAEDLLAEFHRQGATGARLAANFDEAWDWMSAARQPGDLFALVGAGDIEMLADRAAAAWA